MSSIVIEGIYFCTPDTNANTVFIVKNFEIKDANNTYTTPSFELSNPRFADFCDRQVKASRYIHKK